MTLVTIITPTIPSRSEYLKQLEQQIQAQDYPNIEWLIDDREGYSIGTKRNELCANAKGDIIIHMDDDDLYAPDWVSKSVEALQGADITGLSYAYFISEQHKYLWAWEGSQPYVTEATMCYWHKTWLNKPFREVMTGEGASFQTNRVVKPHGYIDGFTARLHNNNTASHLQIGNFKLIG